MAVMMKMMKMMKTMISIMLMPMPMPMLLRKSSDGVDEAVMNDGGDGNA